MNKEAEIAGVSIVTGDTKVVEKGKADKLFINTAGIGILKKAPLRQIPYWPRETALPPAVVYAPIAHP